MAERLGLGPEVRELKLGPTFTNNKSTAFHTLKYDFKPASVDLSKIATVDVGSNNTMTVTVPHLDGAGTPQTVFKGSQRPYHKECVLIIDRITGEITLEKLSSNLQVKKTRSETRSQPLLSVPSNSNRPSTPSEIRKSPPHGRNTSRTKVTSGKKREPTVQVHPKHSPNTNSSHRPKRSPHGMTNNLIPAVAPSNTQSVFGSLPMIGLDCDDFTVEAPVPVPIPIPVPQHSSLHTSAPPRTASPAVVPGKKKPFVPETHETGALSDSSTSSSSSDSSDSDSDNEPARTSKSNGRTNGGTKKSPPLSMPDNLLNDDLQLSSESDSD